MINNPPPFKGPTVRIPIIIPIKGCFFHGSTLVLSRERDFSMSYGDYVPIFPTKNQ